MADHLSQSGNWYAGANSWVRKVSLQSNCERFSHQVLDLSNALLSLVVLVTGSMCTQPCNNTYDLPLGC